jgi:hypothetical protein
MNGRDFLLPSQALLQVDLLNGNRNENRAVYSGCHEFHADSTVTFDRPPQDQTEVVGPPAGDVSVPPLKLPPGLPFRLKLAEDINSATAAAGDPVKAILTSALGNRDSGVYVPAGATVECRIVRIQHNYGQTSSMFLVIRLESVELHGHPHPFSARGEPAIRRFNAGAVSFARQRVELGSIDSMQNEGTGQIFVLNPRANHVFRSGTEMKWLTSRTP